MQRALEMRIAVSRFKTRAPLTQRLITAWVRPDAAARSFFRFTAAGLTAGRTFATRPLTTEATQFGQPDSQRIQPLISYARFKANRQRSGERRGRRIDMHIDQRREPGPPDSGKPERCGRKGTPAICFDTQTTFPSIRAASAWADPAGRHGKRPVICIETGEAFPNAAAASKRAGCSRQTIGNCAAGRSRTAGGYHWAYAEQPPGSWRAAIECPEASAKFESLGDAAEWAGCEAAEIADCLAGKKDEAGGVRWRFRKLRGGRRTMPIVCVETGDEFPSIRAAEEWAGCCHGTISAVLSGRSKTAGGYRWAYAEQREPSWKTPVTCLDTQMRFPGVKEAAAWAGCNPGCISAVLAGRAKTAGGRRWAHAEAEAAEKATMKNGHVK